MVSHDDLLVSRFDPSVDDDLRFLLFLLVMFLLLFFILLPSRKISVGMLLRFDNTAFVFLEIMNW